MNMKTDNCYTYPIELTGEYEMSYGKSIAHKGRLRYSVDFIIPEGTPILASLDGIVVDVKQDSSIGGDTVEFDMEGNYIEIQHANGEYSIYEHIGKNQSLVKKGDTVKTRQIIGYSGATGWLAGLGCHLHFDVHKYFYPFGPEDYETLEIWWKI